MKWARIIWPPTREIMRIALPENQARKSPFTDFLRMPASRTFTRAFQLLQIARFAAYRVYESDETGFQPRMNADVPLNLVSIYPRVFILSQAARILNRRER
jgi:hypothetical protein